MKKDMPLEGLRWSCDSGSALYDTPKTAVLGRAGGVALCDARIICTFDFVLRLYYSRRDAVSSKNHRGKHHGRLASF